jgi:hypothetical protein
MKNMKYIQTMIMLMLLCILSVTTKLTLEAATTTKIDNDYLFDSGKHLDWDGKTQYNIRFKRSIDRWNAQKEGMIRPDSLVVIEDVHISDYYTDYYPVSAVTSYRNRTIRFNTLIMSALSISQRANVCMHELGHALGLAHNQKGDVMYEFTSGKYNLSSNDKASFKKSINR